jgi:ribonuclease P protein component
MDVRATASLHAFPRVGFVIPRYKQTAVARNQLKRRLREIVRLEVLPTLAPCDLVIRVFPVAYTRDPATLQRELLHLLPRLQQELTSR